MSGVVLLVGGGENYMSMVLGNKTQQNDHVNFYLHIPTND